MRARCSRELPPFISIVRHPGRPVTLDKRQPAVKFSANKGLPLSVGRGVCETKSKNGRSRPRKPLFLRFSVLRGGFRDHGLRPWSRKGADHAWGRGRSGDPFSAVSSENQRFLAKSAVLCEKLRSPNAFFLGKGEQTAKLR